MRLKKTKWVRFLLVAAANPCPCGFFGDSERTCTCSQRQVHQYQGRVGGPLMDRIDRKLLNLLQRDASRTNVDLADEVGLSPSSCLRRSRYRP